MSRVRMASAVVLAGLLLTQHACAGGDEPAASPPPSVSASPSPSASPSSAVPAPAPSSAEPTRSSGAGDPFAGDRQVHLKPRGSETTISVGPSGQLELTKNPGDRALFVISKVRKDQFWIRTAKLRAGGEALCVTVRKGSGGRPGTVITAACDAATAEQLFRFRMSGAGPRYTIRIDGDIYIVTNERGQLGTENGVLAVEIGEGAPDIDTPFTFPDQGPAELPALD